jgi:hypothetical protein
LWPRTRRWPQSWHTSLPGVDIEAARHREWLHELPHLGPVARFDNHIQRVLAMDDGFALDTDPVLANIWTAQVIKQGRPFVRIRGRTTLRIVLVTDNEESHEVSET